MFINNIVILLIRVDTLFDRSVMFNLSNLFRWIAVLLYYKYQCFVQMTN